MNTSPGIALGFRAEVLNVIADEVRKMQEENCFGGIEFECGEGRPISISYAMNTFSSVGRSGRYPQIMWADVGYVMRMIARIAHHLKKPTVVRFKEYVAHDSVAWVLHPMELGCDWEKKLQAIFRKVDDALAIIDEPLDVSPSMPLRSASQCLQCRAPLILIDGSDRLVCSEGCLVY